jgi:hypothetical protein
MEFKQMGLKQCAQFDKTNQLGTKLTAWGAISKERCEKKISRKARIRLRKESAK